MTIDLASLHYALATKFPDREAIVQGRLRRTWSSVSDRTNRFARALLDLGLGGDVVQATEPWQSPHDHLGIFLLNGPEYLEAIVGAHRARVAPFNVNYRYVGAELDYLFQDAQPAAILFHSRFAMAVAAAVARLHRPVVLFQVQDNSGYPLLPGALDYETALANSDPDIPATVTPSPTDLHILYTGGTTGMPKGVLWEIGNLIAGPLGLRHRDGLPISTIDEAVNRAQTRHKRVLPTSPLMHGAGMWFALGAWCAGGTVIMQSNVETFDATDIVDTWAREGVQTSTIVGDAFANPIIESLRNSRIELPKLEVLVNAGAALRVEAKRTLQRLLPHVRIVDRLGSSETGPQASRSGDSPTFRPGPNLAVVSEDLSRLLKPGEAELGWIAQSGAIPRAYLNDPAKSNATFRQFGGVRYSIPGDRVRFEEDGLFTLVGRDSTTINTGGEKVFSEEIEIVLCNLDEVVDAIVVGQPSERWGHEVTAVIELVPGSRISDKELLSRAGQQLARYKLPKRIVRVEKIHRHANGKADYNWIRSVLTEVDPMC